MSGLILKACALVCQGWYPRCRNHLFYSIRIDNRRHTPNKLRVLFEHDPWIPTLVRKLTLSCDTTEAHETAIITLLPFLPHLQEFAFAKSYKFHSSNLRFRPIVVAALKQYAVIHTLSLGKCSVTDTEFRKLLWCFPRLQRLDHHVQDRVDEPDDSRRFGGAGPGDPCAGD